MPEFYRVRAIITSMRRTLILLLTIILACWAIGMSQPAPMQTPPLTPTHPFPTQTPYPTLALPSPTQTRFPTLALPSLSPTPLPSPSPTVSLVPTLTPAPAASPTVEATLTRTAQPQPVHATLLLHPDGGLYVGDQVSIEIFIPQVDQTTGSANQVLVNGPDGNTLGMAGFGVYGLGQRVEAMMVWAWDTRGLEAGDYPLSFTLQPGGQVWTETISLLPQEALPWPEPQAHWATAHSKCCTLHYITDTAAERDLSSLLSLADEQARDAVQRMGVEFTAPITITLLSRVLGHGGFASGEIAVSYLDRNYASSDFGLVLHHEMIHILDGRLGGEYRPSLFVEGLAVYKSGGHFKPEPLMPRAAALLATETGLGWYIPLAELVDNFYLSQHEIGYLEGAALIEYMVDTWGWEAFSTFYRDIRPPADTLQSTAIDAALQKHFQITFTELEAKFMDALHRIAVTTDLRDDMRLTVEYFDTVRRYQQMLDPSAFFQTAWLVDASAMRSRGIVADYLRHPARAENQALEALLSTAYVDLSLGKDASTDRTLGTVNAVLNAVQRGDEAPFEIHSLTADYYAIVQAVSQAGYETQQIELEGTTAYAWGTADSAELVELTLEREENGWGIIAGGVGEFKNGDLRWAMPPQIPIFESWVFLYR